MKDNEIPAGQPRIALFLPSLDGGGAERVFVQLANEFVARDLHVDMVLAAATGPYLEELEESVSVVDLQASGVMSALPGLVRYLRSRRPNVLLAALAHANVVAVIAASIARIQTRCVISSRSVPSVWYRENRSLKNWMIVQLMKVTYRRADVLVANCEAVADDLSHFLRVRRDRVEVVLNPVDVAAIDALSRQGLDDLAFAAEEIPLIVGVGRLDPLKDFPTLIHAFARVRAERLCRLAILGEGECRGRLEQLVRDLGLQRDVSLPGFVANPFPWLRRADVLVSSSLTEGCPNAIMQALACGTPVVSTDSVGGAAEVLENGKWGRMVPVGKADAMADAITCTLEDGPVNDGRERARDFAPEEIVRQYLKILLPPGRQSAGER